MTLPWYPRDMGKYARDTKDLSMMEHGAYNLLLDYYYSKGKIEAGNASSNASLLPDNSRAYRICCAITREEQKSVDDVLRKFFRLENGFFVNDKCEEVIVIQEQKHQKRVNAGRKGGQSNASSNATTNTPQTKTKKENLDNPLTPNCGYVDKSGHGSGSFPSENLEGGSPASPVGFNIQHHLSDQHMAKARSSAPGWDLYFLMRAFNGWVVNEKIDVKSPVGLFLKWIPSFTKGKKP